ncbi:ras guanine nucleotide exchange factor domain-containing protein [Polychytrium aggregatum]|uniref:ras guanine nucleotide exchange factor domain-containing protein n=1 Tax=Polychytrium aggregatum TaxID=110093 RepID=UPI0022FEA074|nr:ras guanine nucleotide exchange factor domain-containing protein [Polychytrium aggregatum]KAI9203102.1 ras guanine nucleotide exchange factor domain-containing protein [Polychytrium aggregatum]
MENIIIGHNVNPSMIQICEIVKRKLFVLMDDRNVPKPIDIGEKEKRIEGILQIDPKELANCFTLVEHDRLKSIGELEPLAQLWNLNGPDSPFHCPNDQLQNMINSFNTVSFWAATEICTQPDPQQRAKIAERLIAVAKECRRLNNFSTSFAIISGLNNSSVSRLKATWELVEPKRARQLKELEEFFNPQCNFRTYRAELDLLDSRNYPLIPILGLFMKDLLFINDGNPKYTNESMINFAKLRTVYCTISRFSSWKCRPFFGIPDATGLQAYVRGLKALNEAALYKYSCLCEHREGEKERLLDKWLAQDQ